MLAGNVLAVHPPREIDQKFLENAREKEPVATSTRPGHLVHAPAGPSMYWWIYVRKRELISRNLTVGVHVPLAQQQNQLLFGKVGIELRERNHVERQVPGGVPRVLPTVRHGDHVAVVEMGPVRIPAVP